MPQNYIFMKMNFYTTMVKTTLISFSVLFIFLFSCDTKNKDLNNSSVGYELFEAGELYISLDSLTPSKPPFVQLIKGTNQEDSLLTFYNVLNNSIYWYDLDRAEYLPKTPLVTEGENAIQRAVGYHIINQDSIFVYDMNRQKLVLINQQGRKISENSLIGDEPSSDGNWTYKYPFLFPKTVTGMIRHKDELIFAGSYIWAIPDRILDTFKFTVAYNIKTGNQKHYHTYPKSNFGSEFDWNDPFYTTVYYDWNPKEEKMVYSFPISSSIFTASLQEGSILQEVANTNDLQSAKPHSTKNPAIEEMLSHLIVSDIYQGFKYDPYNNVYYRVSLKGIADSGEHTDLSAKPIVIIIYDAKFNILTEKQIGLSENWNHMNMLVTREGLLIEYLDPNPETEDFLIFKKFQMTQN